MNCSNCGEFNEPGNVFCHNCGAPLFAPVSDAKPEPPAVQQPMQTPTYQSFPQQPMQMPNYQSPQQPAYGLPPFISKMVWQAFPGLLLFMISIFIPAITGSAYALGNSASGTVSLAGLGTLPRLGFLSVFLTGLIYAGLCILFSVKGSKSGVVVVSILSLIHALITWLLLSLAVSAADYLHIGDFLGVGASLGPGPVLFFIGAAGMLVGGIIGGKRKRGIERYM